MTYQEEQNKLFSSFLDRYMKKGESVEFIISSVCNQQCEYCYLFKHGHEMYPPASNNKQNILTNLKLLLEYLEEKEYKYSIYDVFSGEFFQLSFWEEVFQIFYDHHKKYKKKDMTMSIPTNMSFLLDEEETKKVEAWIKKFSEIKIFLYLSCSIDGPEDLEELERPIINYPNIKNKDFYDRLFKFMSKYQLVAHPMVTKNFVAKYKEHYDWWIDNVIKYDCKFTKPSGAICYSIPMFLEVRDPDQWDEESIENYRKFLWYMAEKDLATIHHNDIEQLCYHIVDDFSDGMMDLGEYTHVQPYTIAFPNGQKSLPCSIQSGMVCRVGDLAIVPCHRTCYPHMVYGFLETNNEKTKIIGERGERVTLAHKIQTCNPNRSFLKCSDCEIKSFCVKGCLGSQYENNRELFAVSDKVCDMFKVKYKTIHEICEHYKVYDFVKDNFLIPQERKEFVEYARQICDQL